MTLHQMRERSRIWRDEALRSNSVQIHGDGSEKEQGPVVIRNRDIPLLADILCIMQEISQIEQRREWQRDRMLNITQHLSGMPRGGGLPKGLDEAFAMLSELDEEHEQRCKDYVRQLKAAQKILNNIASRCMRAFVTMKYVMNLPDTEIRQELNLTRTGFNRARRCIEDADCMASVKWRERYILQSVDKY